MRILHMDLYSAFPMARAGGHRTVHSLLAGLNALPGIDCLCVFPRRGQGSRLPEYDPPLRDFESLGVRSMHRTADRWVFDCGYPAWAMQSLEEDEVSYVLDGCMEEFAPEVVWSTSFVSLPVLREARARGLGAFWYLQDARPQAPDLREAAQLGVGMAAVSDFISARVSGFSGRACPTIYPLTNEADYLLPEGPRKAGDPGYVTLINPRPVKGYEIFLGIPELLPQVEFLVVEAWPLGDGKSEVEQTLGRLPNVRFLPQQADVREVYRRTRLLLVPSVVEEGGPRVCREAQLNGIPVLGSPRGGVPESIGDGGLIIDDYTNPRAWAEAISAVVSDSARDAQLSRLALAHARRRELSSEFIVEAFRDACRSCSEEAAIGA